MRQFVRQHSFEFLVIEQAQDAVGHRHRGVLRIAPRGKGIRRLGGQKVDFRHGQPGAAGQTLHHLVNAGQLLARDRARVVHPEHQLVGVEVAEEVHAGGHGKCDKRAVYAAKVLARQYKNQCKRGKKKGCLQCIHRIFPIPPGPVAAARSFLS